MSRFRAFSRRAQGLHLVSEPEHIAQRDLLVPNCGSSAAEDAGMLGRRGLADKPSISVYGTANATAVAVDALSAPSSSPAPATGSRPAVSRNRLVRIGLGICLLAAAGAIYAPDILFTTSSEAIVNARIVTLAAPIDGRAVEAPPPEGTVVAADSPLLTIENPTVDRGRLQDLEIDAHKDRGRAHGREASRSHPHGSARRAQQPDGGLSSGDRFAAGVCRP